MSVSSQESGRPQKLTKVTSPWRLPTLNFNRGCNNLFIQSFTEHARRCAQVAECLCTDRLQVSPILSPELDEELHLIARQAQELTLASGAAIALTAPEDAAQSTDEMTCRASAGEDAPDVGARLQVGSGFSGECVREGKLLRCDDSETDSRVDRENCRTLGIRSMVAVPVKHRESVLGIIEVFSPHTKAFTEGDITELESLAAKVASAVKNSNSPVPIVETFSPTLQTGDTAVPNLLLRRQSAVVVFFGNLLDTVLRRSAPVVEITSKPDISWNRVFVPSEIPWKQLSQSALWHILLVALIWNLSQGWVTSEEIRSRKAHSSITYTPSFPTSGSYHPPVHTAAKAPSLTASRKAMPVRAGIAQHAMAAPEVKLSPRAQLTLASWNRTSTPVLSTAALPRQAMLGSSGRPSLVQASVVAPPPQISGATGQRAGAALGTFVVAPSPNVQSPLRSFGNGVMGDSKVVAPPPQVAGVSGQRLGTGLGSFVVAPSPTVESSLRSFGEGGLGESKVIAPAPGIPSRDPSSNRGVTLNGSTNSVVPPAPQASGSETLASARGGSLSSLGSEVAVPTPSIAGADALAGGASRAAMNIHPQTTPLPPPELDEPGNRTTRELPMRMISLALALPSSSFFSNYEVFIAERRVGKEVSQLIKLVYESRPNQRRISEYDLSTAKVYKLRVTRDVTCDETALQMAGEHYRELKTVTKQQGLRLPEQDGILPCYRSTVDDYQKAIARGR
jgi:hypothetical protein